ncbi:hypothetical protein CDD81_6808 [Ophiocordyceps australis]|uniref:HRQ family protein 2 n=1 Tax=Ophiocordyceps australis TaxID=1399860 RepID=A0A2C5Y5Z8_9HYPO|nr:hypothetical protein CDD81_6808 [Ophiocordyceps australis]
MAQLAGLFQLGLSGKTAATLLGLVSVSVCLVAWRILGRRAINKGRHGRQSQSRPDLTIEPLHWFDWKTTAQRKYRPFKPIYNITMALQSSKPSDLITIDQDYLDRIKLRRSLIRRLGSQLHGCVDHGREALEELYGFLMASYLPSRYPTVFQLCRDGKQLQNLATRATHPTKADADSAEALRVLGETVEEDLFLLHETPYGHRSVALVCCFPAGFDPSSKLDKLLSEIHAPVPSYNKIEASMERFFARVQVGKSVKRLNWTVQADDELCRNKHKPTEVDDLGEHHHVDLEKTFLRVELQTLTRLPKTRALLFSFKTYMYALGQIKGEGMGPKLADAIEGLGAGNAPGMWVYKGCSQWSGRVCRYLRC